MLICSDARRIPLRDGSVQCVVLDPFGGSGTTGRVALELGRRPVLLDLAYARSAEEIDTATLERVAFWCERFCIEGAGQQGAFGEVAWAAAYDTAKRLQKPQAYDLLAGRRTSEVQVALTL